MIKYQYNKEEFINASINENSNFWPHSNYFNVTPSKIFLNSPILSNTQKDYSDNKLDALPNDQDIANKNERPSRKRSKNYKATAKNSSTISIISSSPSRPPKAKRKKSSNKEKQRNLEIKIMLKKLNEIMKPFVGSTELPRIRILRLANAYIEHLTKILNGGHQIFCEKLGRYRPLMWEDFVIDVNKEMKRRNSYSHLVDEYEEKTKKNSENFKKSLH
ncbi:BHLH domain-containing protein [Meloidogyne graminicola]|uniref:BHLH domain-containing protein n=1 Tax=Meloidogyne graminicola TaxID=189291 RepID=A0A8T0A4M5_9BILA|nr:BHLH domain-containing protein [Meloidogyne graminicola]